MNEKAVTDSVKNLLLSTAYRAMFEGADAGLYKKASIYSSKGKNRYVDIYFPKVISRDAADGFKLVGDKGFISLHETYIFTNSKNIERIGYTYKYITGEIEYYVHHAQKDVTDLLYNFHYDMDLQSPPNMSAEAVPIAHPKTHLQVLHSSPRFESKEMNAIDFLEFIKFSCYKHETTPYESITEPIF